MDEELAAVLGSGHHERTEARRGYRHGTIERRLTTADGLRGITVPRGRVVAVPVLVVLGVTEIGGKRLVALRLAVSEAAALWNAVLRDLAQRGLPAPVLVVLDGAAGLQ